MKIAHISDLHFAKATWNPLQFFSKRWLGNVNLLFSRRHDFEQSRLFALPELLTQLKVDHVVICGDVSTTGRKEEFELAASLSKAIEDKGIKTITIPGNHDHYTRKGYRQRWFYDYFPEEQLKTEAVTAKPLGKGWWIVALDTALATSWTSSQGFFSPKIEALLLKTLTKIPDTDRVIMANHFPFFEHDSPRKTLQRGPYLQETLRNHPKVKFYLHGHTHRHCIADLRADGLPILLDSGSTPHRQHGTWNLIDIAPEKCTIEVFSWEDGWQPSRKVALTW
jgi:3',5'-cyclic AMP phosphodiesterase CpdA